jgi:hypothetical protein
MHSLSPLTLLVCTPSRRPGIAEHTAIIEDPIPANDLFDALYSPKAPPTPYSPAGPSLDGVDIIISESRRLHLTPHGIHPNNETSTVNESVSHENKTVKGVVWAI